MGATPTVYVICDANCKWESLTKEQIITAITQAVNEGTIGDIDTGFVTTIKTISGKPLKFFVGSQTEYTALSEEQKQNLFAIITDDISKENLDTVLNNILENVASNDRRITKNEKTLENHASLHEQHYNAIGDHTQTLEEHTTKLGELDWALNDTIGYCNNLYKEFDKYSQIITEQFPIGSIIPVLDTYIHVEDTVLGDMVTAPGTHTTNLICYHEKTSTFHTAAADNERVVSGELVPMAGTWRMCGRTMQKVTFEYLDGSTKEFEIFLYQRYE